MIKFQSIINKIATCRLLYCFLISWHVRGQFMGSTSFRFCLSPDYIMVMIGTTVLKLTF
jgi:hypothetical protein